MKLSVPLAIAGGAAFVAAHGGVVSYELGGTYYTGWLAYNSAENQADSIQREWDTYDPVTDPTSSSITCNTAGSAAPLVATVAAGDSVTAYWNNPWPHSLGPLLVWMAECPGDCTSSTPSGNSWFKIDEAGLISGTLATGTWGQGEMISDNSSWTSTIPSSLAAGNYLLRHEVIALHSSNAPQFYPECAQLVVTGSGTSSPSSEYLASLPGVYTTSDPSLYFDPYSNENQAVTTYDIPGPPVWTG